MPERIDPERDPEEPFAQQRIAICRQCEHYRMYICGQCGCFMPMKTRLKSSRCPINLWLPVED